jgi:hypothetical protein
MKPKTTVKKIKELEELEPVENLENLAEVFSTRCARCVKKISLTNCDFDDDESPICRKYSGGCLG